MKLIKVMFVMALALCLAAPAFAEMKLNGFYRLQGTFYDNGLDTAVDDNDTPADLTDDTVYAKDDQKAFTQRLRMKLTNQLNENVSFVYYGEFDLDFGQGDKFGGNGAKPGADGNALETKNVYLNIKGDKFNTTLGVQGMGDTFDGIVFSDDFAGVTFGYDFGAADLALTYSKQYENNEVLDDDRDLYGATLTFAATDMITVGASVYMDTEEGVAANSDKETLYYGLNVDAKVSDALALSAWGLMADFDDDAGKDGDTYLLSAKAAYKLDMGNVNFGVLYAPEETAAKNQFRDVKEAWGPGNLMFLGGDAYATNNGYGEDKYYGALTSGAGLTALWLTGTFNFDNDIYAGFGLAYADCDKDDLGTEFGASVGKKFFGNVDVSVRAAQWNAGGLYNAEDETKVIGMVNVGF